MTSTLSEVVGLISNLELITQAKTTHKLKKEELVAILTDPNIDSELYKAANEVRKKYVGNAVHLRGLIEFSNICKCNCYYCGLRGSNKTINRYRMSPNQIYDLAQKAKDYGYKTVVLQSGEDNFFTTEILCELITKIKKLDLAITLSIGEKTKEEYLAYKKAGADRYLLRIETTDKKLYKKLHPNMDIENRINCLKHIKEAGFELGTGCLVGLPNQTIDSLAEDILFFKEINTDMVGLGPFIPCPNTPLEKATGGNLTLALKVMALTRLMLPDINIPATTAMETLLPNGRIIALNSGANVVMPNVTDQTHKEKYTIYPGKAGLNNSAEEYQKEIIEKIKNAGRTISQDYGFRKRI